MKFNIVLTSSKLMSWFIAIASTAYAFYYESNEVIIAGFTLAAGVYGHKQWQDARKQISDNKH